MLGLQVRLLRLLVPSLPILRLVGTTCLVRSPSPWWTRFFDLHHRVFVMLVPVGLSAWGSISHHLAIVLHPATVEAMRKAKQCGCIECAHPLQGSSRWVILVDGSCVGACVGRGPFASWAFIVLERVGAHFRLVGFRSGRVSLEEGAISLGSQRVTNTGETEALGHALGWAFFLDEEEGDILFVVDSTYAIQASQALRERSVGACCQAQLAPFGC